MNNSYIPSILKEKLSLFFTYSYGIVHFIIFIFLSISLLSFDINDNSFLTKSSQTTNNLGGEIGSYVSSFIFYTIDVAGDINLDAGGSSVLIVDDGTGIGRLRNVSNDFIVKSEVSDQDLIFKGNDGGTEITALTLDMSAAGAATFNNDVTAFSDERLKSDITTLKSSLEKVLQMRGVSYTRNDNPEGGERIGVIAQEVEKFYPQVVLTADDERGTKSVDYGRLTAVLIEAVKELSELVNRDISSIKKDIDAICRHPLWQQNQMKGE